MYVVLSCRRISTYRARLKDLFASTEDRELNWIVWIAACVGFYLVVDLATVLSDIFDLDVIPLSANLTRR